MDGLKRVFGYAPTLAIFSQHFPSRSYLQIISAVSLIFFCWLVGLLASVCAASWGGRWCSTGPRATGEAQAYMCYIILFVWRVRLLTIHTFAISPSSPRPPYDLSSHVPLYFPHPDPSLPSPRCRATPTIHRPVASSLTPFLTSSLLRRIACGTVQLAHVQRVAAKAVLSGNVNGTVWFVQQVDSHISDTKVRLRIRLVLFDCAFN